MILFATLTLLFAAGINACMFQADDLPEFTHSGEFQEATCVIQVDPEVRIYVNRPEDDRSQAARSTRVILYATPNGNTIEQTLGRRMEPGSDWHFDIQHVAAQTRLLRTICPHERIVLICAEAKGLSWPAWRARIREPNSAIAKMVDSWRERFGDANAKVTLTGHSGGGSFVFGLIEGLPRIPTYIDRIALLDANYSYEDERHANKIADWLRENKLHRLIVIAYDDRNIELNGNKVVGPEGGTYRATHRMLKRMGPLFNMVHESQVPFDVYLDPSDQLAFHVHRNPDNKILHTALVGDMNGLIEAQIWGQGTSTRWGKFGGPRAYSEFIDGATELAAGSTSSELPGKSDTELPRRAGDAVGGIDFMKSIDKLPLSEREKAIEREICAGNFPDFLRSFVSVPITDRKDNGDLIRGVMQVMPDYLSVGGNDNFVRIPMTPQTAQAIATRFGCVLPTRKMVDAIDAVATLRLNPIPLTKDREAISTFVQHHQLIQSAAGNDAVGQLITGIKKDIVVSPLLRERPGRLALYGWRNQDGSVIQNLTTVHVDRYVDYSHGARLVRNLVTIDGKPRAVDQILGNETSCGLLSDEGVVLGTYAKHDQDQNRQFSGSVEERSAP